MIPSADRPDRLRFWAGLVLLIAGLCTPVFASPDWLTRVWRTDDGLPDNNVEAIAQGPDDYLWIVTSAGLTRFDGISFNRFSIQNPAPAINSHIRKVVCGRSGVVWMVADDGTVSGLNPDFSNVPCPNQGLPPRVPQAVAEDGQGALWLGYFGSPWTGNSNAIYRVENGQITQFGPRDGLPFGNFHSLTSDEKGNIWVAQGREIRVFRNGRFQYVTRVVVTQYLAARSTKGVWYVANGHLFACDSDGTTQDCGRFQGTTGADALALLQDHNGSVWIGTDGNGLFRYTQSGFEKIETSHPVILSLAEDHEGNIWAGTAGGGLDRISLNGVRLENFENDQSQIQSICEDARGVWWGADQHGLLVSLTGDTWRPVLTNAPFAGTVRCVAAAGDIVWLALRDGQLVRLANTNYTMLHLNNRVRSSIFALAPAPAGDLWVLRRDVLQRLHNGQLKEITLPQRVQRISALATDSDGNVWLGAKGVVMRFDGQRFTDETPQLPIAGREVPCIYATADGAVWISCSGFGLLRFKAGRVGRVGIEQGLFDDNISQMVADGHGWIWFGSDHGIFKIRQRQLEAAMKDPGVHLRPVVYGKNEGLASVEAISSTAPPYVLPLAILGGDGVVRLLGHSGVMAADSGIAAGDSAAPPVLLTRIAMDGQTIAAYGGIVSTPTVANLKTLNVPMRLPPSHRHLEFDFTAFHFSAPENVRFRYQLVGFDTNWIDSGTERSAIYSRLTAGNYQFHVEACIGDGPWSEAPATAAFVVAPFVWQTWSFRIGVLVIFTSLVIAIVRYVSFRRLQMELRLTAQRAALEKERTRIARDLHDDLGGSLNSVALTLDMAQRLVRPELVNGKLQHCSTTVRQAARSVDEIVWAINPRNDTLRYLVDYLSQYTVEFLHAADLPCRVDLPDRIPDRMISPEARHNLLLVVKEALNNIARHAGAGEVRLRITASENTVSIAIEDNGRGFENTPDNASCDGLRNMRQRMEEIGGQFELASRAGQGTRISAVYSLPAGNHQ